MAYGGGVYRFHPGWRCCRSGLFWLFGLAVSTGHLSFFNSKGGVPLGMLLFVVMPGVVMIGLVLVGIESWFKRKRPPRG